MKNIAYNSYLTESKLGALLNEAYGEEVVPEFAFEKSKFRYDYAIPSKKVLVEFDGDSHYRDANVIFRDLQKEELAAKNGFRIIRIPYFVQLKGEGFQHLFGWLNPLWEPSTDFPHGFITTKILPASFCAKGIQRFERELQTLPSCVAEQIVESLQVKINKGLTKDFVFGDAYEACVENLPAFDCMGDDCWIIFADPESEDYDPDHELIGVSTGKTMEDALLHAKDTVESSAYAVLYNDADSNFQKEASRITRLYGYIT